MQCIASLVYHCRLKCLKKKSRLKRKETKISQQEETQESKHMLHRWRVQCAKKAHIHPRAARIIRHVCCRSIVNNRVEPDHHFVCRWIQQQTTRTTTMKRRKENIIRKRSSERVMRTHSPVVVIPSQLAGALLIIGHCY